MKRIPLYYGRLPWCDFWRSRDRSRVVLDNIVIRRSRGRGETFWEVFGAPGILPFTHSFKTPYAAACAYEDAARAPLRLRFNRTHRWLLVPDRGATTSTSLVLIRARDLRAVVEPPIPDPEAS